MANNCTFSTTITADPERLTVLKERLGEDGRLGLESYNNLFDEQAPEGFDWGSKWTEYSVEYYDGEETMYVSGDTAWGPVTGLWQRISEKYEAVVETKYEEPGCDFGGSQEWSNGECTFQKETTYMQHVYDNDQDYFWDEIESKCYDYTMEEIIDDLGELYESLADFEKKRISDLHEKNYSE